MLLVLWSQGFLEEGVLGLSLQADPDISLTSHAPASLVRGFPSRRVLGLSIQADPDISPRSHALRKSTKGPVHRSTRKDFQGLGLESCIGSVGISNLT